MEAASVRASNVVAVGVVLSVGVSGADSPTGAAGAGAAGRRSVNASVEGAVVGVGMNAIGAASVKFTLIGASSGEARAIVSEAGEASSGRADTSAVECGSATGAADEGSTAEAMI